MSTERPYVPAEPPPAPTAKEAARRPPREGAWVQWVLVVLTLVAMGRVLTNGFSGFDDDHTIWGNPRLNPPRLTGDSSLLWYWSNPYMSLWVPVTYTVWGGVAKATYIETPDSEGSHVDARAFHAASLAGHIAGVLLVYAILRRLVRRPWAAGAGALIYAIHPLQVEAVAWASGLKDVLAATFALGALACYLRAVGGPAAADAGELTAATTDDAAEAPPAEAGLGQTIAWHAAGLICFALGLLSKPSAMVMPLLAAAIDFWLLRRPLRRVVLAALPYAILAIPVAIVAKQVQSVAGVVTLPPWQRPLLAGGSLAFYLWKLVAPVGLAFDSGWRPTQIAHETGFRVMAIAVLVLAIGLWVARRRWPGVWTGAVVFAAGLLPVLGFVPFAFQYHSTVGDHYAYLAMLGPALAAACGLARLRRDAAQRAAVAVCAVAGAAWVVLCVVQLGYWSDPLTNLRRTLAIARCSALADTSLGHYYLTGGRQDVAQAEQAFRAAIECNPDYVVARGNLVRIYASTGRTEDALREFHELERANALLPEADRIIFPPDIFLKAGQNAARGGYYKDAERYFEEAVRTNPSDPRGAQALEQVRKILSGAVKAPVPPK